MTEITVSIIIPAYNTADVISRTLNSIEAQTYKKYEIIIINDGSTDGTAEFLDHYRQQKDNVAVHHQKNQGVSSARNAGLALARGKYVCFLDSDDTYEPEFLALMVDRLEQEQGNVVYCGYNRIGYDNKKSSGNVKYYNGSMLEHFFQKTRHLPYLFHLSCLLIKKSFLIEKQVYFEVGRKISEDVAFIVRTLSVSDVYSVDKNLYNYFYRENSAINASYLSTIESDIAGWKNLWAFIDNLKDNDLNKQPILDYIEEHTIKIELSFMKHLFKYFKFHDIRQMVEKNNLNERVSKINQQRFSSTERKMMKAICSGKLSTWIMLSIYYRFLKFNVNGIKKRFYKKRSH